jgi:RNase P/RNase MRP subunit POP5
VHGVGLTVALAMVKKHGKRHMAVDCLLRIDAGTVADFERLSAQDLVEQLRGNIRMLFGVAAAPVDLLLMDAVTRVLRVTVQRSAVDNVRAACVLVSRCSDVPVRLTVAEVVRHSPKRSFR